MNAEEIEALIRPGIAETPAEAAQDRAAPVWADFGAGTGAFTLALADLLGTDGQIIAVDLDRRSLGRLEQNVRRQYPASNVRTLVGDFTQPLDLPPLDGAVMANTLHFIQDADKAQVLRQVRGWLRPGGHLLVVEYNSERGNVWVPHPFSYPTWERLASESGFARTRLLATVPSRFLGEIYSALSVAP